MDDNDDSTGLALGVGAAVTALVIALVIALAIGEAQTPRDEAGAAPLAASAARVSPVGPPVAVIHFATGSARLPSDLAPPLLKILKAAREAPSARLWISSVYLDKDELLLVRQRAMAVEMALIGAGIPQDRILIGETDRAKNEAPRQARRIEVFLVREE